MKVSKRKYICTDNLAIEEAKKEYIVGENIINKVIDCHILPKECVRFINGVPMAIKMMF